MIIHDELQESCRFCGEQHGKWAAQWVWDNRPHTRVLKCDCRCHGEGGKVVEAPQFEIKV